MLALFVLPPTALPRKDDGPLQAVKSTVSALRCPRNRSLHLAWARSAGARARFLESPPLRTSDRGEGNRRSAAPEHPQPLRNQDRRLRARLAESPPPPRKGARNGELGRDGGAYTKHERYAEAMGRPWRPQPQNRHACPPSTLTNQGPRLRARPCELPHTPRKITRNGEHEGRAGTIQNKTDRRSTVSEPKATASRTANTRQLRSASYVLNYHNRCPHNG
jgi:hypothetical protein